MKKIICILLLMPLFSIAQQNEFPVYANGLIYDESTMNKLGKIVDSLNLKFKSCDLNRPYLSFPQGQAWKVVVKRSRKEALHDMRANMSLEQFKKKYPHATLTSTWISRFTFENYENQTMVGYSTLPSDRDETVYLKANTKNIKTNGWVIPDYAGEKALEVFFVENLSSKEIPFEYARLIQYVDCMIDTTASIYFPQAEGEVYRRLDDNSKASRFVAWANDFTGKPDYPDYDKPGFDSAYSEYYKRHRVWDSARLVNLDAKMPGAHYWKSLLIEARDEAFQNGNSSTEFEFYVERYLTKADALKLKRGRKVIGNCSQDQSPRYHAMNICQLAAETTQWDIFLRSHLDIMNDRFERQTDGSYAWGRRQTYLKELEELDIPATDLILGTCFRVTNVGENHYLSSIGRAGRALSDAADKEKLQSTMLTIVKDQRVDLFNRLLFAYLFSNYNHYIEDEAQKKINNDNLEAAIKTLPEHGLIAWKDN
jgi:hypothetical protein